MVAFKNSALYTSPIHFADRYGLQTG